MTAEVDAMTNRTALLSFLFLVAPASAAFAGEAPAPPPDAPLPFFREPAISPDGSRIVFGHLGDLWAANADGSAAGVRLTDHRAYDCRPAFSPKGDLVAFSSDREGAMDVFVIPDGGGEAKRLTFHSADDLVLGWTPDGSRVLFLSQRDTFRAKVYAAPLQGGEPSVALEVPAASVSFSPDGKSLAFVLGASSWWRRNYRGSGEFRIWVKTGAEKARRIPAEGGNDTNALWARDGTLWFLSDRGGVANLWRMNPAEPAKARPVTSHLRHPVLWPSISADGGRIAYACLEGGIYLLDARSGKSAAVPLKIAADDKENPVLRETFADKATEMAVSPDGREIAIAVRGDLFVVKRKGGKARPVTETPARERHPAWTPDGKALLFVSDRNGSNDVFLVRSDDPSEPALSKAKYFKTETLAAAPEREERPKASPDGKRVLYLAGLGDLWTCPIGGGAPALLAKGPLISDPSWSPDSRWVAFAKAEKNWNSEIYVVPAEGGTPVNVTRDPDDDIQPVFSPKGDHLYFSSNRGGAIRFNVHRIPLTLKVWQRDREEEKEKEEEEKDKEKERDKEKGEKGEGEKGGEGDKKKEEKPPDVSLDFEKIEDRAERITSTRGDDTMPVLSDDGKTLFFKSDSLGFFEIWKAAADGSSLERLTRSKENPEELQWVKKDKELLYRAGGAIKTLSEDGQKQGAVPAAAAMEIDLDRERLEAFDEAWTLLRDWFYDPSMHGVDWEKCRREYRRLAGGTACAEDFNDVVRMMLGELGASHLGIFGPDSGRKPEPTGLTGMLLTPGPGGKRYLVASVLKKSPADREESKVRPGEFLVAVNRAEIKAGDDFSRLLNGKVGENMDFLVATTEDGPGERTVTFKPADPGSIHGLLYEAWVEEKRALTDKLSAGRLGYIHIRSMSGPAFESFRREYLARVREKDGLVLDVRNNPGGYIHNQLWELLSKRTPVGFFRIRGAETEAQPDYTWQKPVVLLINERSGSDAEIFPWGFRKLGLGKVIGVPTWGGVIGTDGAPLIHGAWFRLPLVGWYTDEGKNLENWGVPPDVRVENHPEDEAAGIDAQLERAVQEALQAAGPARK
jgi:tricorn protease